jgi:hypothetical protein
MGGRTHDVADFFRKAPGVGIEEGAPKR